MTYNATSQEAGTSPKKNKSRDCSHSKGRSYKYCRRSHNRGNCQLHLARNAKSVVGKTTSKPYVKVQMTNVNLVA